MFYPKNKFVLVLFLVFIICSVFISVTVIAYQIAVNISPPYHYSDTGEIHPVMPIGQLFISLALGFLFSIISLILYYRGYKKSLLVLFICFSFSFKQTNCGPTPELNKKIVLYIKNNMGKQVARGECWDLAAEALNNCEATWDGSYGFGKVVNYKKDCVYPGDVIQFKNVKLKYTEGEYTLTESLEHHTALVYEVKSKSVYVIADQNNRFTGKNVGVRNFDLTTTVSGSIKIYRPVK